MLTAQEAADQLGISKRTVYDLAAPAGPVPCYRIGRAVRFDQADIDAYKQSRRCEPVRVAAPRQPLHIVRLKASSPAGESGLREYFRRVGLLPKEKPGSHASLGKHRQ